MRTYRSFCLGSLGSGLSGISLGLCSSDLLDRSFLGGGSFSSSLGFGLLGSSLLGSRGSLGLFWSSLLLVSELECL